MFEADAKVRAVVYRGGTSKGVILRDEDLPANATDRAAWLLKIMGSPDARQIDGLGGADPLTSKIAIVGRPKSDHSAVDIHYTFVQVGVRDGLLAYDSNCGNISAAVAAYAVDEGYVPISVPVTIVRIFNTNTQRVLVGEVPTDENGVRTRGDFRIDGVPGTGAPISLDYVSARGSVNGAVLPTGNVVDRLRDVEGGEEVLATISDFGNLVVYVTAAALGVDVRADVANLEEPEFLNRLERLRRLAAVRVGVAINVDEAGGLLAPLIAVVDSPKSYDSFGEYPRRVLDDDFDVSARLLLDNRIHKAYSATCGVNLAVTALIPGTLPHSVASPGVGERAALGQPIHIGHPSGIFSVLAQVDRSGDAWVVNRAAYQRTARRIMDGYVTVQID